MEGDLSPIERFMMSAEGNVAFAFSWSTQALVLPRLAKTERSGYWATTLSYGVVAPFFVATGGVMALAMFVKTGVYESDPTTRNWILRELYDCEKWDAKTQLQADGMDCLLLR